MATLIPEGLSACLEELSNAPPRKWLVTGGAGFIGSHLVEHLLMAGQIVVTLDNFATGRRRNLDLVESTVGRDRWTRHTLIEGDITAPDDCARACAGVNCVLHQAALGSVPRSIKDPITSNHANVTGFLNMAVAARDAGVSRFVFASSSSVYGDHPDLPKQEDAIGRPLSPYAVTKYVNELYAHVVSKCYGMEMIGLRYFNVFGPRQDPEGPYAAVIPRWVKALLANEVVNIFGDGETSRDFCYVKNAVEANLRAAMSDQESAVGRVYNIAVNHQTTLTELFTLIRDLLVPYAPSVATATPSYGPFRDGDVRHSLADISRARDRLNYSGGYSIELGLREAIPWYAHEYADQ